MQSGYILPDGSLFLLYLIPAITMRSFPLKYRAVIMTF
jgi:hypothetical protein